MQETAYEGHPGGATAPSEAGRAIPTYDVRLRREITQRRLAVSLCRRMLRVLTLHVLDGALLTGVLLAVASAYGMTAEVRPLIPALVVTFLLSLNAVSAYAPGEARRDRRRLTSGVLLALLLSAGLVTFPPHLPLSHLFLVGFGCTAWLALAAGRKLADEAVRQVYARGIGLRRTVIVGDLEAAGRTLRAVRDTRNVDQYVVGHLCVGPADPAALGSLDDLAAVLDGMDVQEVLVASPLDPVLMGTVTRICFERGTDLFVLPTLAGPLDCWAEPCRMGDCALLRLHPARLEFPALLAKRAMDMIMAGVFIVITAPLFLLIAVAIKIDSPGPVFFRHQRLGLGGNRFMMWKFRSMAADAEAREHELSHLNIYGNGTFKLRYDPRVTRVGRVLRRTSLDELPQLWNVMLGQMSLVGPRPALVNDIDRYEPHHFERLTVVPGITGPWQVGGRNLITDFEEVLSMEREYIRRWSLLLDLKIMVRTVGVVIRGEGAY